MFRNEDDNDPFSHLRDVAPQEPEPEPEAPQESGGGLLARLRELDPRLLMGAAIAAMTLVLIGGCIAIYVFATRNQPPPPPTAIAQATSTPSPTATPFVLPTLPPTDTPTATATIPDPSQRYGVLSDVGGIVDVRLSPERNWSPATTGLRVYPGATLRTGENSRLKITFSDGAILRLSSQTQMTIADLSGAQSVARVHVAEALSYRRISPQTMG